MNDPGLKNFHSHTTFSDGENTAEEMVRAALELGFTEFGISDHSFTSFDPDYCMPFASYEDYKNEIRRLKEAFQDHIRLFSGIEQDYYSDFPAEGFDYIIGSVHYLRIHGEYVTVDWGGKEGSRILTDAADRFFHGDIYSVLELYFETVSDVVRKTGADIIGHFDVIRKSNEQFPFFDPLHPRYIAAWQQAAKALASQGTVFEINVSPLLRKNLTQPHPAQDIQDYLNSLGSRFLYSGDSHSVERLRQFAEYMRQR